MDTTRKKHTFFSDVLRSISPRRTVSSISVFRRRKDDPTPTPPPQTFVSRSCRETLTPLMEGPDPHIGSSKRVGSGFGDWVREQLLLPRHTHINNNNYNPYSSSSTLSAHQPGSKPSDLRLLLGVMGAPLAPAHVSTSHPFPHLSIKTTPIEASSAQYILQQYTAASGGSKILTSIKNAYAMGKLKMVASEFETANKVVKNRNPGKAAESGCFVLWQMNPDMWYVELAVGGSKVHAGCNGKLVWRHTPWLGAHTAKGPVRPLRRTLQVE